MQLICGERRLWSAAHRRNLKSKSIRRPFALSVNVMATTKRERRPRDERQSFRVDQLTKTLIEHAAQPDRRRLTDFCMTALAEAARRTIAEYETSCCPSERAVFFDALVNPLAPSDLLARAFADHKRRVAR
jgi:uncharacterized protein (DUF1778 family)